MTKKRARILPVQLFVTILFLVLFLSLSQADVTLTIGEGSGPPGSSENLVSVSLTNSVNKVKGVQIDVCDVDDYLNCTGCEITDRTTDFTCLSNEITDPTESSYGCCRVGLFTMSGNLIEEGTGTIFTITFDVSDEAPLGECIDLNPEEVGVSDENNKPIDDVTPVKGEFCFNDSGVTTTTTTPITTSSSTTSTTSPYSVSISPLSATLSSGATLKFSAKTTYGGEEIEGTYAWKIDPASTIGSTINGNDDNGLFTAGDNNADSDIEETVKVTDTAHENTTAEATVTIVKKEDPGKCQVMISPLAASINPGDNLTLDATLVGNCNTPSYQWSLDSNTNSTIEFDDAKCEYTAGENYYTNPLTDFIAVNDTVNVSEAEAEITIAEEGIEISPDTVWKHWIPLPYTLVIESGNKVKFDWSTAVEYEPSEDVCSFITIRWDENYIWDNIWVMPSWLTGETTEKITVIVTTGTEEVVKGIFHIKLFTL